MDFKGNLKPFDPVGSHQLPPPPPPPPPPENPPPPDPEEDEGADVVKLDEVAA